MHSRSFFRNPSPILVGPCGLLCVSSQGVCSLNCFLDFQFEILDEILLL